MHFMISLPFPAQKQDGLRFQISVHKYQRKQKDEHKQAHWDEYIHRDRHRRVRFRLRDFRLALRPNAERGVDLLRLRLCRIRQHIALQQNCTDADADDRRYQRQNQNPRHQRYAALRFAHAQTPLDRRALFLLDDKEVEQQNHNAHDRDHATRKQQHRRHPRVI